MTCYIAEYKIVIVEKSTHKMLYGMNMCKNHYIFNQWCHQFAKCCADDDTNSQIDHIATENEFFKVTQERHFGIKILLLFYAREFRFLFVGEKKKFNRKHLKHTVYTRTTRAHE